MLGLPEIIIILIIGGLILFGGKRTKEIARSLGRFTGEFKKGKKEVEKGIKELKKEIKI